MIIGTPSTAPATVLLKAAPIFIRSTPSYISRESRIKENISSSLGLVLGFAGGATAGGCGDGVFGGRMCGGLVGGFHPGGGVFGGVAGVSHPGGGPSPGGLVGHVGTGVFLGRCVQPTGLPS